MLLKDLIDSEDKWCQFALARRSDGSNCIPEDSMAVQWCLIGGLQKCYGKKAGDAMRELLRAINLVIGRSINVRALNDNYDWPIIKAVLDRAGV